MSTSGPLVHARIQKVLSELRGSNFDKFLCPQKLKGHIALGLFVYPSVCASITKIKLQFGNFINRFVTKSS